jgi:23S rRNA (uracil1939-C5)-methyltransferase
VVVRSAQEKMIQCTVEKMVYGGYGLAYTDKGVVFIEQVLPEETVEIEIIDKKGGVPIARPLELLRRSPHRRQPACEYYGICGGCDWQYILYPQQLQYKHDIFVECLNRIGKIETVPEIEIVQSPEWEYRLRAQLKVDTAAQNIGFYRKRSNDVIEINRCPLLTAGINTIMEHQKKVIAGLPQSCKEIRVIAGDNGSIASSPVMRDVSGDSTVITVAQKKFSVTGNSFFQGNSFLLEKLGLWAKETVSGDFFIDMYGGVGFFSIMLADNFSQGLLVESSKKLTEMAQKNFSCNDISHLTAEAVSAENFFKNGAHSIPAQDCLIVDPPRPGLTVPVREGIRNLKPASIVYISCNPSTQARDVGFFIKKCGYSIEKAALFDLYPQTHHIETVLLLSL